MRQLLYISIVVILAACKAGKPSGVLSESKMERILYQYHLAKGLALSADSSEIKGRAYILAVLRDNGVSEAEFDSSLVWYYQHMEVLQKVYKRIGERLHNELGQTGAATNDVNRYSNLSSTGDTANIWNGRNYYLLSGNGFANRFTYELKADTIVQGGDQLLLNFRAQFVQKQGSRHAVACLAVEYANDSISHTLRHIYGSGDISLSLTTARRPLRRVYGYLYMISEWNVSPHLLFIFSPSLVRIHTKPLPEPEPAAETPADSSASAPDTITPRVVPSSLNPGQMHSRPVPRKIENRTLIPPRS